MDKILRVAIQLKGGKQYFPIMTYKMVFTFAPGDKRHKNHSDRGYCEYFNGMLFFYFTFNTNIEVWGREVRRENGSRRQQSAV